MMEVFRQRIRGTDQVLYHVQGFHDWGPGGRFTDGYVLQDSAKTFVYHIDSLVFVRILMRVHEREVSFVSFDSMYVHEAKMLKDQDAYRVPVREETKLRNGMLWRNVVYRSVVDGLWCGLNRSTFERFEETRDSLVLHGVQHGFGRRLPERFAFPKGGVQADLDSTGHVLKFTHDALVTGVDTLVDTLFSLSVRRNPVPFPVVCDATYELTRQGAILQKVSDYGVFKSVYRCSSDCPREVSATRFFSFDNPAGGRGS